MARDIHDSLLQSAAGSALQLLAARRLLDRDPDEARRRLEDVQNQLERGEFDMSSFIQRLRPASSPAEPSPTVGFAERLEEFRRRVERQLQIADGVKVKVDRGSISNVVKEGLSPSAAPVLNRPDPDGEGESHGS